MTNDVDTRIMIDVENYKNIFVHEFEENKIDDNLFLKTYVTYFYLFVQQGWIIISKFHLQTSLNKLKRMLFNEISLIKRILFSYTHLDIGSSVLYSLIAKTIKIGQY